MLSPWPSCQGVPAQWQGQGHRLGWVREQQLRQRVQQLWRHPHGQMAASPRGRARSGGVGLAEGHALRMTAPRERAKGRAAAGSGRWIRYCDDSPPEMIKTRHTRHPMRSRHGPNMSLIRCRSDPGTHELPWIWVRMRATCNLLGGCFHQCGPGGGTHGGKEPHVAARRALPMRIVRCAFAARTVL